MELLLADQIGFPSGFDGQIWASPQLRRPRKHQMPSYLVESLPNSDGLQVRQRFKEVSFAEAPKFSYFHPIIQSNFEIFRKKQDQRKKSSQRKKLQNDISEEHHNKEDKQHQDKLIQDLHYLKIFGDKQSPLTIDCIQKISQIFTVPSPTKRKDQMISSRYSKRDSSSQNDEVRSSASSINISQNDEQNSCHSPVQQSIMLNQSQPYFYYQKSKKKMETNLSQKTTDENEVLTLKNIINTRYNNMSETESNAERDSQILSLPQRNSRSQFSEYLKGDETLSRTFYSHNRSLHQQNTDNFSYVKASTRAFTATPQSRYLGLSQKGLENQNIRQRYSQKNVERVKTASTVIHRTTTPSNSLVKNSRIGCFSISTNDISLLKTNISDGLRGRTITEKQQHEQEQMNEKQSEISEKTPSEKGQIKVQKQADEEFAKNIAVQQRSLAYTNRILSKKYGLISREKYKPKYLFL